MKKKKSHYRMDDIYRDINTTQEKRAYYSSKDLVRAKRNPSNIPDAYWDIRCSSFREKSWKKKRKTQYRDRSCKQERRVEFGVWLWEWDLGKYLDYADVPFRLTPVYEIRTHFSREYIRVKDKYVPVFCYRYEYRNGKLKKLKSHQSGWEWTYKTELGENKESKWSCLMGYELVYWSDEELNFHQFTRKIL